MNNAQKLFVDTFNQAAKRSSRTKLFDDFLDIAVAALNRDEQTFAAIDNKPLHLELFALLMSACNNYIAQPILRDERLGLELKIPADDSHQPHYHDVLGEIFHALELFDQNAGQVFTPQHTADIAGSLALNENLVRNEIRLRGFVTIQENCCGSGALVLGALNALLAFKINPCTQAFTRAGDIDSRCVAMTFIQLALYGIPALVARVDAISQSIHKPILLTPIMRSPAYDQKKFRCQSLQAQNR